nr:probable WRKY transcription factor 65 [Tanacetum cinerariifolium]
MLRRHEGCPKLEEIMVQRSWDSDSLSSYCIRYPKYRKVPITEIDGSQLKSETNDLPSDSWAWRKHG